MKKNIKGIAREALEFVLEVSASSHPKEFAGMLYETNNVITHVDVPITQSSNVSAVMDLFTLPVNPHLVGTVHSHPNGVLTPSDADIKMFMQSGPCHIVVGCPYDMHSWACYDRGGDIRALDVLDVEIDESDVVYNDIRETFGSEND
ncbi:MAG: Mov34/MPN/PAD-1 family protein [Halobacteriota archaeon]